MIDIHIKTDRDRHALAQMIASTQGEDVRDPAIQQVASLVRTHQAEAEKARPSQNDMATVNFHKIDSESDWTDV
jgi:hypothetical protein